MPMKTLILNNFLTHFGTCCPFPVYSKNTSLVDDDSLIAIAEASIINN